jgi:hypothetical protein
MWRENNFLKAKSGKLFAGGKEAAEIPKEIII